VSINLTLIGQLIAFTLFVWICMVWVWPPLISIMRERQQKIADGLARAEEAEKQLSEANEGAEQALNEAKATAAELIDQAHKRAMQIVEDAKVQAREEGDRLKRAAEAEIEQELNRAKEALREDVSRLALQGAEKILGATVDRRVHQEMLERLAAQL